MSAYQRQVGERFAEWLDGAASALLEAREVRHTISSEERRVPDGAPADVELKDIETTFGTSRPIVQVHQFVRLGLSSPQTKSLPLEPCAAEGKSYSLRCHLYEQPSSFPPERCCC